MTNMPPSRLDILDDYVRAYEGAVQNWRQDCDLVEGRDTPELTEFLPAPTHPLFAAVLRELVRIDLEFRWENGHPRRLREYQTLFPDLFRDPVAVAEVAYEEYRLRLQAGDQPTPQEYEKQFGIATDSWSAPVPSAAEGAEYLLPPPQISPSEECDATQVYQSYLANKVGTVLHLENGRALEGLAAQHARLLHELSAGNPPGARRLAEAMTEFPSPGAEACGFRLLAELGRGAFGRVFLARQGELADRPVALKFSPDTFHEESQTLAQLQHTNIVPIYSVHRVPPFVVVCMPYFGSTTLADVIRMLGSKKELPASGKELAATILEKSRRAGEQESRGAGEQGTKPTDLGGNPQLSCSPALPLPCFLALPQEHWQGLSFIEAVLSLTVRITEGLQHAHERGIIHRDLKPANVLLTDEGEPMLLDFNLSENLGKVGAAVAARIGGTLPYMSPECLKPLLTGSSAGDARSDLYALGIILYEMLTSHHPFPSRSGPALEAVALLLNDRQSAPPSPRRWNRAISPAVAAIVLKCLQPDPARRYQSAAQLREDLECQLRHRPLRHAPDRSVRERAAKFVRRHPRIISASTVAGIALALLAGLLALVFVQGRHQTRMAAQAALRDLREDLQAIPFLLSTPDAEPAQLVEGMQLCQKQAKLFGVLGAEDWQQTAQVQALDEDQREELRQEMGALLWFWARAALWKIPETVETNAQREQVQFALWLNSLAGHCYAEDNLPGPLLRQRARLLELAGDNGDAKGLWANAEAVVPRTPWEKHLAVSELVGQGKWFEARPLLQQAVFNTPGSSSTWLVLANCQAGLGEFADSKTCFDLGIALAPNSPWAWFNRGLLHLQRGEFPAAKADFTQALKLRPNLVEALMNRALAELKANNPLAAVNDLNQALEQKAPYTRIYFLRAQAKLALKDKDGGAQDQEKGLSLEPADEQSWVARGEAHLLLKNDPNNALADFEQALKINPRFLDAWQNKAHVLSEYLKQPEAAIKALNRAIDLHPSAVLAWAGRGVLLARQGKRMEAHRDAVKALALDHRPAVCYQAAGIYALTSRTHPADRKEALRLLQLAVSQDKTLLSLVPIDPDLNGIRNDPHFLALLKLAEEIHGP